MANTFKVYRAALGASASVVYTVPASTTAIVLMAQAANVDNTAAVPVTSTWNDGTNDTHLVKALDVPVKAAVNLLSGKLVLEAGDTLSANSDASNKVELTVSVLEIT
jgi:hypothetical protein